MSAKQPKASNAKPAQKNAQQQSSQKTGKKPKKRAPNPQSTSDQNDRKAKGDKKRNSKRIIPLVDSRSLVVNFAKALPCGRTTSVVLLWVLMMLYAPVTASWPGFIRMILRVTGTALLLRVVIIWLAKPLGFAEGWILHHVRHTAKPMVAQAYESCSKRFKNLF